MLIYKVFAILCIVVLSAAGNVVSNSEQQPSMEQYLPQLHEDGVNLSRSVHASNNLSSFGYDVYPGQFPYHAGLIIKNDVEDMSWGTSGVLITPNYILTEAAQLYYSMDRYGNTYGTVKLGYQHKADGEWQQQIGYTNSGINLHPQRAGIFYNLATIRLEHPVTLTRHVQPIRLPRLSDVRTYETMEGTAVGRQQQGTLRYMRNQVMANVDCQKEHAFIDTQHVCTNTYIGGSFCTRSVGAGLTVEDENGPILIGMTGTILSCSHNLPIMYIRLSMFRDWIGNNSNYVFDF